MSALCSLSADCLLLSLLAYTAVLIIFKEFGHKRYKIMMVLGKLAMGYRMFRCRRPLREFLLLFNDKNIHSSREQYLYILGVRLIWIWSVLAERGWAHGCVSLHSVASRTGGRLTQPAYEITKSMWIQVFNFKVCCCRNDYKILKVWLIN